MFAERRTENGREYWILIRAGGVEALIISRSSRDIFPVFSFREEAELFLWLNDLAGGWSVRSASAADLVALLLGDYSAIDDVALDPLPEARARPLNALVTMSRLRFVAVLLGRDPDALSSIPL